jgi:hypothetical protein
MSARATPGLYITTATTSSGTVPRDDDDLPDAPKARPFGRRENAGVPRPSGHHAGVPAKPRTFPSRQKDRPASSGNDGGTTQRDRHARSEEERRTTQRDRHVRSGNERRTTQRDRPARSEERGAHDAKGPARSIGDRGRPRNQVGTQRLLVRLPTLRPCASLGGRCVE